MQVIRLSPVKGEASALQEELSGTRLELADSRYELDQAQERVKSLETERRTMCKLKEITALIADADRFTHFESRGAASKVHPPKQERQEKMKLESGKARLESELRTLRAETAAFDARSLQEEIGALLSELKGTREVIMISN